MTMAGRPPHYCKDCSLHFDSETSLRVHLQYHKENLLSMWAPQHGQMCNNNNKPVSPLAPACEPTTSSARVTESPSSSADANKKSSALTSPPSVTAEAREENTPRPQSSGDSNFGAPSQYQFDYNSFQGSSPAFQNGQYGSPSRPAPPPYQSPSQYVGFNQEGFQQQYYGQNQADYQSGQVNNQYNNYWSPPSNSSLTVLDEKPNVAKEPPSEPAFSDSSAILDLDTNRLLFHGDKVVPVNKDMMPLQHQNQGKCDEEWNAPRDQVYGWQGQPWNGMSYGCQQQFGQHAQMHAQSVHPIHQRIPPSMRPGIGPMGPSTGSWYSPGHPHYLPPGSYPSQGLKTLDTPGAPLVPDWMSRGSHLTLGGPLSPDYGLGKDEKRNRPFQCQVCDKFFIRKGHLNRHLTTTAHKSRVSQKNAANSGMMTVTTEGSGISSGSSTDANSSLEAASHNSSSDRDSRNLMTGSPNGPVIGTQSTNDVENLPPPVPSRVFPPNQSFVNCNSAMGQSPRQEFGQMLSPRPPSTSTSTPNSQYGCQPGQNFQPPNASPILQQQVPQAHNFMFGQKINEFQGMNSPRTGCVVNGSPEGFEPKPSSMCAMMPQPQPQPQLQPPSYQHYHDTQMNVQSCFEPPAKVGVGQLGFQHQAQVPQSKTFPNGANDVNHSSGEQHFMGQTGGQFVGNYYSGTFHQFPSQNQPANVTGSKNVDMAPAPHPSFHHSVMAPVPAASAPTHHQPATIASAAPLSNQHQNQALAQVQQHQGQINSVNLDNFGNVSPPSVAQTPPMISPYSPPTGLSGQFGTTVEGSSPPSLGPIDEDGSKKRLTCPICKKRSSTEAIHEEHMLVHKGEKPYKCTMCPKQFGHKTDLRRHLCLHTGEKPFACPVCGKRFIRKDHMTKHGEVHKKEDNYVLMTEFTDVAQHVV